MATLQTLSGPLGTPAYELTGQFITIGRARGNTIHLNHRSVSKYHALIILDDDKLHLVDLHSTNGTYVSNLRITTSPLNPNDEIVMGEFVFRYETADVPIPVPLPLPVKAPGAQPVQETIAPQVFQKLAVPSTPPATTATDPNRAFIRLPGETPAEEKPSLVSKLLKRDTTNVKSKSAPVPVPVTAPQPPDAAPAPVVEDRATTPPTPAGEQVLQKPAATGEKGESLLLKKPGAPGGGERLLIKKSGGPGVLLLKKPAAPKE